MWYGINKANCRVNTEKCFLLTIYVRGNNTNRPLFLTPSQSKETYCQLTTNETDNALNNNTNKPTTSYIDTLATIPCGSIIKKLEQMHPNPNQYICSS
jgi:hypothetical protein